MGKSSETIDDGSLGEGPEGARTFRRGVEVGRYVVLDRVGAGAMGIVVAAYDTQLDRKVALKFLLAHRSAAPSEGQARLVREAQSLSRVSHPNVVAVHEAGTIDGYVFIAMEFVAGQTVRRWLAEAERTPAEVIAVFVAAGRGLAAVHAAGLVHRDVKPDNIMIGPDGHVRLMDFGLARAPAASVSASEDDDSPELSRKGAVVGTPAYMSPEQHAGEPADARSDQFAFCVALHEALFGRRPFAGTSLPELVRNVGAGERIAEPSDRGVARSIRAAIERGSSPDPADRFASMDELLAELERDPDRPRRRIVLGGTIAAFALIGVIAYEVAEHRRIATCTTASRELGEVWNESTRAAVRDPSALDAYAAAWSEAASTVCLASRVETTFTLEQRARAEQCLQRGKEMFGAVVEVLAEHPAMDHAAVGELSPPEACADPEQLEGPAVASMEPELRHRLDRARVLLRVGEHAVALSLLDGIDTAEALALRGAIERDLGLPDEARASYEAAFFEASRTGDDALVAESATRLAMLATDREPSEAQRWLRHAEAAAQRSAARARTGS